MKRVERDWISSGMFLISVNDVQPSRKARFTFPEGDLKNSAVNAVLGQWLKSDPGAATAWVQSLPDGNKIIANLDQDQTATASNVH